MEATIYDKTGKKTGKTIQLNDAVFGIEPNDHAIYLDVKQYRGNNRQGTHKAKERGEITGSTRKIKRQKGTGTARAGSIKSPVFRGGGRIFGPRVRSYETKLNKKVKQLARRSALSYKAKGESLHVLEDLTYDAPKTKQYVDLLSNLEAGDIKTLLVLHQADKNVYLSSRNLPKAKVVTVSELSTYDILDANKLLISESSVKEIENLLS